MTHKIYTDVIAQKKWKWKCTKKQLYSMLDSHTV